MSGQGCNEGGLSSDGSFRHFALTMVLAVYQVLYRSVLSRFWGGSTAGRKVSSPGLSLLVGFQGSDSILNRYQRSRSTQKLWEILHTQSMRLAEFYSASWSLTSLWKTCAAVAADKILNV